MDYSTILSQAIEEKSDKVVVEFSQIAAGFDTFLLFRYVSAFIAITLCGIAISQKKYPQAFVIFAIAVLLNCTTLDNRPTGYALSRWVNNKLSKTTSDATDKLTKRIFTKDNTIPSVAMMEGIAAAMSSQINDPAIKNNVRFLIQNCLGPNLRNRDGTLVTPTDLFNPSYESEIAKLADGSFARLSGLNPYSEGAGRLGYSFDIQQLKNRNIEDSLTKQNYNCYEILKTTTTLMRDDVGMFVKANLKKNGAFVKELDSSQEKLFYGKIYDLATYNAMQREIMKESYGDNATAPDWDTASGVSDPYMGRTSRAVYKVSHWGTALKDSMGVRGAFKAGIDEAELSLKTQELVYGIAAFKVVVCMLYYFAAMSLYFLTARFFIIWLTAYLATAVTPGLVTLGSLLITNISGSINQAQEFTKFVNNSAVNVNMLASSDVAKIFNDVYLAKAALYDVQLYLTTALLGGLPLMAFILTKGKEASGMSGTTAVAGTVGQAAGTVAAAKIVGAASGPVGAAATTAITAVSSVVGLGSSGGGASPQPPVSGGKI